MVEAARLVPPAEGMYLEDDFVMNLLATVVDYQMRTTTVERALAYFRANRWDKVRTLADLEALFGRFANDKDGNTALAQHLWGYKLWTRAEELRALTAFFVRCGVTDQQRLRAWAARTSFETDFEGKVKGLGPAIYNWLVMRQGVDTVKPDVHVRRFAERAVGRHLTDTEVVAVVTSAAHELGQRAYELDWAIWESQRRKSP